MIETASGASPRGWAYPFANILSLVIAIPMRFAFILLGMGVDSGPNVVFIMYAGICYSMIPLVLLCAIISQITRSQKWAIIGFAIPIVFPAIFFITLFIMSLFTL
ncbi:MAG TPA: hypothetical protein VM103_00780 [Candidatus Paceibacterota bacterium]|nr:hypothetical protein [Candidatus Paceibacterota bacterium]